MRALFIALALLLATAQAASASAFSTYVLSLNPSVFYELDETTGTIAYDASPNADNATIETPGSITLGVPGLDGSGGTAYNFGATSSYVSTAAALSHVGNQTFIFIISASTYTISTYQNIVSVRNASAGIQNGHPACGGDYNGGVGLVASGYVLTAGTPHFLALVGNGITSSASLDGGPLSVISSSVQCAGSQSVGGPVRIGAGYYGSSSFVGVVDDVAIFPAALTNSELCEMASLAGYGQNCSVGDGLFLGSW
jgi:hypothetical protein